MTKILLLQVLLLLGPATINQRGTLAQFADEPQYVNVSTAATASVVQPFPAAAI